MTDRIFDRIREAFGHRTTPIQTQNTEQKVEQLTDEQQRLVKEGNLDLTDEADRQFLFDTIEKAKQLTVSSTQSEQIITKQNANKDLQYAPKPERKPWEPINRG